jgi:hypothetical protein
LIGKAGFVSGFFVFKIRIDMQFETMLDLFGMNPTVESIDAFYRMIIPQLFESLDTSMTLSWKKVNGRFQTTFEIDDLQYVMYVEELIIAKKLELGIPSDIRCINLGFSLIDDGVELETLQNHLATSSIKVFSIVVNGFKEIVPIIIDKVKPDVFMLAVSASETGRLNLYSRFLRNLKFPEFDFILKATDANGNKILMKTKIPKDRQQEISKGLKNISIVK